MRLLCAGIALALASAGFADTITLKDGRVLNGTYLGGSPRQIKLEIGSQIQTVDVSDVARIEFGGVAEPAPPPPPPPPPPPVSDDRPSLRREEPVMRPEPSASPAAEIELPQGTNLVVRLIDGVDSETARQGQTYQASLDQPVVVNDQVVIPRGADVVVKLVDAKQSGTFTGRAELALNLQSVRVNGRMVDINTQSVKRESGSQGGQTAKRGAAGAIVGAGLGAVFGGGKGAAEGAAIGGAAGAGTQVITKGQKIRIPSETRLTFILDSPVRF